MKRQMINDVYFITPQIVESKDDKFLKFKGVFQRADTINENGRIYPKKVLEKAVNEFKKRIEEGRAVGTIEHPADGKTKAYEISHKITDIYMNEQGEVIGEAIVVETSKGKELKALLEAGVSIGISSRGFGSMKPVEREGRTIYEVQEDFQLETFDVVYNPSTPGAFAGVTESKEDKKMEEKIKELEEKLKKLQEEKDKEVKEKLEDFAEKFMNSVNEKLEVEPDIRAALALESIIRVLSPIVPEIAESLKQANEEAVEEMQKQVEEANEKIKQLELENYKLQKIAESHEPEKLKEVLSECKTKEDIDKAIEEHKKKKLIGEGNKDKKPIDESSVRRKRVFSRITGNFLIKEEK